jgi:hypothetical protein
MVNYDFRKVLRLQRKCSATKGGPPALPKPTRWNRKGHHHEAIVPGKDCTRMARRQKAGVGGLRGIGPIFLSRPISPTG